MSNTNNASVISQQYMMEIVRNKFKDYPNVTTEIIDIQDIFYPDNKFDIVIANSMLYHIPNLPKAISEVDDIIL